MSTKLIIEECAKLIPGKLYRRNNVPHNSHAITHSSGGGVLETWTWNVRSFAGYHDGNTVSIGSLNRIDMKSAIMYLGKETDYDVFLYEDKRLIVMYPEEVLKPIKEEE